MLLDSNKKKKERQLCHRVRMRHRSTSHAYSKLLTRFSLHWSRHGAELTQRLVVCVTMNFHIKNMWKQKGNTLLFTNTTNRLFPLQWNVDKLGICSQKEKDKRPLSMFFIVHCFFQLLFSWQEKEGPFLFCLCPSSSYVDALRTTVGFTLGLVLFQRWARQLAGQLFRFGPLVCEWSYGDYTWQAVRNWTGSSGKQGSTTPLPFSTPSKHAHNNKNGTGNAENFPSLFLNPLFFCFFPPQIDLLISCGRGMTRMA